MAFSVVPGAGDRLMFSAPPGPGQDLATVAGDRSFPIRSVVIAGVEDLFDKSKVLLNHRRALDHPSDPHTLIRRRCEELTQK
jgi:hypothetical protein